MVVVYFVVYSCCLMIDDWLLSVSIWLDDLSSLLLDPCCWLMIDCGVIFLRCWLIHDWLLCDISSMLVDWYFFVVDWFMIDCCVIFLRCLLIDISSLLLDPCWLIVVKWTLVAVLCLCIAVVDWLLIDCCLCLFGFMLVDCLFIVCWLIFIRCLSQFLCLLYVLVK